MLKWSVCIVSVNATHKSIAAYDTSYLPQWSYTEQMYYVNQTGSVPKMGDTIIGSVQIFSIFFIQMFCPSFNSS